MELILVTLPAPKAPRHAGTLCRLADAEAFEESPEASAWAAAPPNEPLNHPGWMHGPGQPPLSAGWDGREPSSILRQHV